MKQKKTMGGSIGLLSGVVIAILALVRGPWQLPLLIGTFAVWGLWLLWTQVLPFRRTLQAQRRQEQAERFDRSLAQLLLRHVNYRVSDCLKAVYPDARWEWMMRDPALFVAQGGTGRIRVYGIPEYEFADVTVDQNGKLSCARTDLARIDPALIVGKREGDYGCQALINDRAVFQNAYPDLPLDPPSLEDLMIFTTRGDRA